MSNPMFRIYSFIYENFLLAQGSVLVFCTKFNVQIGAGRHVSHPCKHEWVWLNSLVRRPPWLYASSVKNKNKTKNNLCLLYVGDVDRAFQLVIASNGLEQTQFLAKSYGKAALHSIQLWKDSHAKDELIHFITTAIERTK